MNGPTRRVKLVDFGVARELDASVVLTADGTVVGTPLYMAPEQLRAHPASFNSDVYAVATIVFELLAGRAPFVAETAFAAIGRVLLEPAPSLGSLAPDAPQSVVDVVDRALSKEPTQRPSTDELLRALRREADAWSMGSTVAATGNRAPAVVDLTREQRTAAVLVARSLSDVGAAQRFVSDRVTSCEHLQDGTLLALIRDASSPDAAMLRAARVGLDLVAQDATARVVVAASAVEGGSTASNGKAFARRWHTGSFDGRRTRRC